MPLSKTLAQTSLAAAILASTIGTYIALSPPNPSTHATLSTGDAIRSLHLTGRHSTKIALAPLGLLSLHTSSLVYFHPRIPSLLLGHGAENGLNANLITWSAATSIPLALILCAGIPLRLVSYASLGRNFTFALMEPDRLTTTGIYGYVQHPSYTGIAILVLCNVALLCRFDGALSYWIPPTWFPVMRKLEKLFFPVGLSVLLLPLWTRVTQEEQMLKAEFGAEWEKWHSTTWRFIPWVF
ncbi:hypothetical protein PV08_11110 [Exophiala spinifera]|uniref:Protein-S-isoprenylcysteine O-methyltransferase n=1 Tax=Exophiala spinifera TaxID=91928 RepID=A0A0D2BFL1_9EURO|nr:uncharacterized protein PV08_11110 [Exophiala spinifera]KIW10149.1 hypothetical protein PV08_11110 [Exophiala spinifera]